jgi:hypothetical protein
MLRCSLDVTTSNKVLKEGTISQILEKLMKLTKPESAYFTADGGTRTIYIFFDMKDSSELPPIGELVWSNFGGKVEFQPAMNQSELEKGISSIS